MSKEAVQVVAESEHLSISKKLIKKFSREFGLSPYQTERAKTIADNPIIQDATQEYSRYMAELRQKTNVPKEFEDQGFKILQGLRGVINQIHPITKNQSHIYRVAVIAIEHTQNQVED